MLLNFAVTYASLRNEQIIYSDEERIIVGGGGPVAISIFSLGLSQTKSISNQVHMAMKSACFGYADSQKNGFQIPAANEACR